MGSELLKRAKAVDAIKDYILKKNLPVGTKLPGAKTLASRLNCSHHTIHNAFDVLQEEGIVEIRERSGTYLAPQAYENLYR